MTPHDLKEGEVWIEEVKNRPSTRHPSHRAYRRDGDWIETFVGWWQPGGIRLKHEGRERA